MLATLDAEVLYLPPDHKLRFLPEGPYALGEGKFSWVAIQHGPTATKGSLNIYNLSTRSNESYDLPGRPGFARPTSEANVFIVGCERELGLFNIHSGEWRVLAADIDRDVTNTIINDGTMFGNNLVFGTKDLEFKTAKAGLYLFRGDDQKLIRMRNDQICSNGKDVVFTGDGAFLIDIDSPTRRVVRYRLDVRKGELSNCETLIDLTNLEGVPDGMVLTPDEQSAIISFYNPNPADHGETHQYSLVNGDLERIWRTPKSPQATCPLLIDDVDGSVKLVITTAVEHMPAERQPKSPWAGALFIAKTNFHSAPPSPVFPL
jgi:sugar lactone lactonase YvrE